MSDFNKEFRDILMDCEYARLGLSFVVGHLDLTNRTSGHYEIREDEFRCLRNVYDTLESRVKKLKDSEFYP
ncbi:hypothetical protein [Leptospira santarosai]|uniref:hypothetical protein n=1 Tax=Leptospira santarosai TaxID=28183 RepID=UPI000773B279|nr:hypothetical protein [Leptospira santarosai]